MKPQNLAFYTSGILAPSNVGEDRMGSVWILILDGRIHYLADKRHLHFDGPRRVHLTSRLHFPSAYTPHELPHKKILTLIYYPIYIFLFISSARKTLFAGSSYRVSRSLYQIGTLRPSSWNFTTCFPLQPRIDNFLSNEDLLVWLEIKVTLGIKSFIKGLC